MAQTKAVKITSVRGGAELRDGPAGIAGRRIELELDARAVVSPLTNLACHPASADLFALVVQGQQEADAIAAGPPGGQAFLYGPDGSGRWARTRDRLTRP